MLRAIRSEVDETCSVGDSSSLSLVSMTGMVGGVPNGGSSGGTWVADIFKTAVEDEKR